MFVRNLKKTFSCRPCLLSFFVGTVVFSASFWYFFHFELTAGNYGPAYAYSEAAAAAVNAILFGAYAALVTYRFKHFGDHSKRHSGIAAAGAFASALVAGCPACAPTLASALGLVSIASVFPFGGLGLKALGALMLAFAVYWTASNLEACKTRR